MPLFFLHNQKADFFHGVAHSSMHVFGDTAEGRHKQACATVETRAKKVKTQAMKSNLADIDVRGIAFSKY